MRLMVWVRDSDLEGRTVHAGYLNRGGWPLAFLMAIASGQWACTHAAGCTKLHGSLEAAKIEAEQWLVGMK